MFNNFIRKIKEVITGQNQKYIILKWLLNKYSYTKHCIKYCYYLIIIIIKLSDQDFAEAEDYFERRTLQQNFIQWDKRS